MSVMKKTFRGSLKGFVIYQMFGLSGILSLGSYLSCSNDSSFISHSMRYSFMWYNSVIGTSRISRLIASWKDTSKRLNL
jgi:hypothetical protein